MQCSIDKSDLKPVRSLDSAAKMARRNACKKEQAMSGRFPAPHIMHRPDRMSGGRLLFSPVSKTWATKTTTKTV
jgi:hypothetical protein